MATHRTFDEIVLSRRRLLGTAAGAAGAAALAGGALPGLTVRGVTAQDGAKEFHTACTASEVASPAWNWSRTSPVRPSAAPSTAPVVSSTTMLPARIAQVIAIPPRR